MATKKPSFSIPKGRPAQDDEALEEFIADGKAPGAKPAKRKRDKPSVRRGYVKLAGGRVVRRVTLHLPEELGRRLDHAAVEHGVTASELIAELIDKHLEA